LLATIIFGGAVLSWNDSLLIRTCYAESPDESDLVFEKPKRRKGASKEGIRDLISSQHLQVKRSWENPGVYAWGDNSGRVVAPDSAENTIKTPRRIAFFDNRLLRDIKLDRDAGAAIDENGDLLQWGAAYYQDCMQPTITLRGKDLSSIRLSRDRILALSKSGSIYSLPISKQEQEDGVKAKESSWVPFWSRSAEISYQGLSIINRGWWEKIDKIAAGLDHGLLLTNKGRVFSVATSSKGVNKGQLGVSGLLSPNLGEIHELKTLKGFEVKDIACGDSHSLCLDSEGRIFGFGDNSSGQIGFETGTETSIVDVPGLLSTTKLFAGTSQTSRITSIAAGGNNSYFTTEATKVSRPGENVEDQRGLGRLSADTWAFGSGIWGNLANGRWTHIQSTPVKIPSLSSLYEYDETTHSTIPIRLAYLTIGSNHAAAVMDNVTYTSASNKSTDHDTNWGADIVFWGNNEFYQLGTGKRNNLNVPSYIQALDQTAERKVRGKEEHRFQITPRKLVTLGDGRTKDVEQRVECGRGCTAVYSRMCQ